MNKRTQKNIDSSIVIVLEMTRMQVKMYSDALKAFEEFENESGESMGEFDTVGVMQAVINGTRYYSFSTEDYPYTNWNDLFSMREEYAKGSFDWTAWETEYDETGYE